MGLRGPQADPSRPNSRAHGNRKTGSTAYQEAQIRKLAAGEPKKPRWVKGEAADIWREIVPELFRAKLTHAVDCHLLGAYCLDMAEYVKKMEKLSNPGKALPETQKLWRDDAQLAFRRAQEVAVLFGMNPKSRTAMGIKATDAAPEPAGDKDTGTQTNDAGKQKAVAFVLNGGKR